MAGQLFGLEMLPLRDESSISVISRLALWNVFRSRLMNKLGGFTKSGEKNFTSFGLEHVIDELTGWKWSEEDIFFRLPEVVRHAVVTEQFRFCPICLQGQFHSRWFQLVPLAQCPLHGCEILERCVHCGEATHLLRYSNSYDWSPYRCIKCKQLVFGAPLLVEGFGDLMATERLIYERFLPIRSWFQKIVEISRFLEEAFYPCWVMYKKGSLDAEYRLSVLNKIVPFPPAFNQPMSLNLTVLKWDVPAFSANQWQRRRAEMDDSSEAQRHRSTLQNKRMYATFLATVRKIEQDMPETATDLRFYMQDCRTLPLRFDSCWNPDSVSIELVRQLYYRGRSYGVSSGWLQYSTQSWIDGGGREAWPYEAHHVDRLCTRAATLSAFSVMRGAAYEWKRSGLFDNDRINRCFGRQILVRTFSISDAFGIAIFPTVEWLRLDPFRDVSDRMISLIDEVNGRLQARDAFIRERFLRAAKPEAV